MEVNGFVHLPCCLYLYFFLLALASTPVQAAAAAAAAAAPAPAVQELSFSVGIVAGQADSCSGAEDAHLGHLLFATKLASEAGAMYISDLDGVRHRILFNYTRYNDGCEPQRHEALLSKLINDGGVHFVFGSSPAFARQESIMSNNLGRLIYHCCHVQDELLEQDMKHVFSIQASNTKYPIQAVKSMVVAGGVGRLYIFSLESDEAMASTCQAAANYSLELEQLHSGFRLVQHRRYTSKEAADRPSLYEGIVDEAIREKADAVLGCDLKDSSMEITQQFHAKQHYLKALWLANAPIPSDFAAAANHSSMQAAENVLSAAQWHPGAHFADAYFGTAAHYIADFEAAFGKPPSEMAVAATAASYSLAEALKQAFELCRFPDLAGRDSNHTAPTLDVDRVLFNQSAVECVVQPGMPVSTIGYEWVRYLLAKQRLDTVFGKVEFDDFRRNIAKEVVTTQVQSGTAEAVLPLELANRDLVMPAPEPASRCNTPSSDSQFGGLSQGAFIAIIIVCGSGCILTLMGIQGCLFRMRRGKSLDSQLVIDPKELQIISAPECQWDDSWESGKAMYKSVLVSLDPLPEIWNEGIVDPARSSILKQKREGEKSSKLATTRESARISSSFEIQGSSDMGGSIIDSQTDIEMGGSPKASRIGFSYKTFADLEGSSASQSECDSPGPCSATGTISHSPSRQKRAKFSGSCSCPVFTMILTRYEVLKLFWRSRCLQHPSVVPVIGIVWSLAPHLPPSMPVLVRECQELGALASVMENETMTIDAVKQFDIAKDLSDALAYLHTRENPTMKPILQPRLEGVLLDKHCRARVCVPLAALSDALSGKATVWVEKTRENARALAHAEEIEDVQTFGIGVANLFTAGKCGSNPSSNAFLTHREELVHNTILPCNQYQSILTSHGTEMAELISRCCSICPSHRPCFVEVKEQLEAKHSKMVHDVARTRLNSSSSKGSRNPADAASSSPSADELLYELFPVHVADALKSGRLPDPEPFPMVSLFFSDVCGYTNICSSLQTHEVMDMLHRLYSRFDELAKDKFLFKVETVGDAYLCVANLKFPQPEHHARIMAEFAFGCLKAANNELICTSKPELGHIHIRVGIHAGPVMGAVVGTLNRRYGLFGDSVNVASRMESTSIKDHIQCSSPYMQLLREQWSEGAALAVAQGPKQIKGKGSMETFLLFPPFEDRGLRNGVFSSRDETARLLPPELPNI